MMENTEVKLIVFLNEFNEIERVYNENDEELMEFISDKILYLVSKTQRGYNIHTQLVYHLELVGALTGYYNAFSLMLDDLKPFLELYNELYKTLDNELKNDKLSYELVTVDGEEEQEFIEYVSEVENGYQKYKENNNRLPQQTILVTIPDKETPENKVTLSDVKTDSNIEEIISQILSFEISMFKEYSCKELLCEKVDYVRDIFDIGYRLKQDSTPKYDLLLELKNIYNNEYSLKYQQMTIETQYDSVSNYSFVSETMIK